MVPFERNPSYVNRTHLDQIKSGLFRSEMMARAALCGLGGVGKTQIAIELAYQAREQFRDCSIFWISAVNHESIHQAYVSMADQLGIEVSDVEKDDLPRHINEYLSQESSGRWLLIFDNADDIETWSTDGASAPEMSKVTLPRSPSGAILFTTRSLKVARHLASQWVVEIPEMDEESAMNLLEGHLFKRSLIKDYKVTKELLERLTYLPLAIVQAASFMSENGCDILTYISLLDSHEQQAIDLLSEDFEDGGRHKSSRNPIATTWLTSFSQIHRQSPIAADYLSLLACMDYSNIPVSFLRFPTAIEHQRALGVLQSYSFIRLRPEKGFLDMHRLVHLAMRNSLRSAGSLQEWQSKTIQCLSQVFPHPTEIGHSSTKIWRSYLPHTLSILEATSNDKKAGHRDLRLGLMAKSAIALRQDGRLSEAEKCTLTLIKHHKEVDGADHPETIRSVWILSTIYTVQARWEEARNLLSQILHSQVKLYGSGCYEISETMSTLALVQGKLGETNIAEWLAYWAIRGELRELKRGPRNVLVTMTYMINIYLAQGRVSDATAMAELIHSITLKTCGPDHPDTVAAEGILGLTYQQQGRWKDAECVATKTFQRSKDMLGPNHPATIDQMNCLAHIINRQGRVAEATALMAEYADLCTRVQGPNSSDTQNALRILDEWKNNKYVYLHPFKRFALLGICNLQMLLQMMNTNPISGRFITVLFPASVMPIELWQSWKSDHFIHALGFMVASTVHGAL